MSRNYPIPDLEELLSHAEFLRALVRSLVLDDQQADDVVQETYLAALGRGKRPVRSLRGWLAGTALNLARMARRGAARRGLREREAVGGRRLASPEEAAERLEMQRRLVEAVQALPDLYRVAIVHRFFDGLSSEEIASRLGVPSATVRTRVRRALALLRDHFDRERGGDRREWMLAMLPLARPARGALAGSALLTGGFLVTLQKVAAAVIVVLAAGLGVWSLASRPVSEEPETPVAESTGPGFDEASASPGDVLPEPVEESAVDRDRDLFGVVVDVQGDPVAGAHVRTFPRIWRPDPDILAPTHATEGPGARTAPDGTFRIPLARGRFVDVCASADGSGERWIHGCLAGQKVRIVLGSGGTLEVHAGDESGRPVSHATAWVVATLPGQELIPLHSAETNAEGTAWFAGLPPGRFGVVLIHQTFAIPSSSKVDVAEHGTATADFVLRVGREIRGTVRDAKTGAPIAGALVGEHFMLLRSTRTDEHGAYTLRGCSAASPRAPRLYAVAAGFSAADDVIGARDTVDFLLERGDELVGRLLSSGSGAVAGALVSAIAFRPGDSRDVATHDRHSTRSGPDGRFRIPDLRRDLGPHTLVVQAEGEGRVYRDIDPAATGPGRIDLGDIVLPPGRSIEGVVEDVSGKVLSGVVVTAEPSGEILSGLQFGGREIRPTDDLGRFRFPDLAPGEHVLEARVQGVLLRQTVALTGTEDARGLVLRPPSEPEGTLVVMVEDANGEPIAGAQVSALGGKEVQTGVTDSSGRAVFRDLAAVPHLVQVLGDKTANRRYFPARRARVMPGGQVISIVMKAAALIRGRVSVPEGVPASGLEIRAGGPGEKRSAGAWTGEGGVFEMEIAPGAPVDLVLAGNHRPEGSRRIEKLPILGEIRGVAVPSNDVEIVVLRVARDRSVRILVLDEDGKPVAGALLQAASPRDPTADGLSDGEGRVVLSGLREETYRLHVSRFRARDLAAEAVHPESVTFIPAGQEIVMRFQKGVLLRGRVLRPDGTPAARATIDLLAGETLLSRVEADERGRFAAPALPGRPQRLRAYGPPGAESMMVEKCDVVPDGRAIEVHLEPGPD